MGKIRKKDHVIVIAGKDKGKRGEVLKVLYKLDSNSGRKLAFKAVVEGINLFKKHKKADPANKASGGIISKEMPIAISNIAIIDPKTNRASKVGFKFIDQENVGENLSKTDKRKKKIRYFKSSQEVVDV